MTTGDGHAVLAGRFAATYTGALTDVLHELDLSSRTLPPTIRPLRPGMRLAGPAFTIRAEPEVGRNRTFDTIKVLKAVPRGHVVIWETGADDHAVIGDLAVAFLAAQGCAGLVLNGGCRDVDFLAEIGLPVFCRFVTPQDMSHGRGAITACDVTLTVGGVEVAAGDYVVADADGVVVVPRESVHEVLERAEALVRRESIVRAALLRGSSWEEAHAAGSRARPPDSP
jgi:regulator of RNase E activity RraA